MCKEYKRLAGHAGTDSHEEMDGLDYSKVAEVAFGHDLEKIPEKLGWMEKQGTEIELTAETQRKTGYRLRRERSVERLPDYTEKIQNPKS